MLAVRGEVAQTQTKMSNYEKLKNAPVEDAELISLRFISELEKVMDKQGITRADLARMIGTSKSYLTQIWRGDKVVNMNFLSKCCTVLNFKFVITATPYTSP